MEGVPITIVRVAKNSKYMFSGTKDKLMLFGFDEVIKSFQQKNTYFDDDDDYIHLLEIADNGLKVVAGESNSNLKIFTFTIDGGNLQLFQTK